MSRIGDRIELALGAPLVARAIAACAIGAAVLQPLIVRLMGWPGLGGVLAMLVVLALGTLWSQRLEIEWRGLLPLTLMAFLGWSLLSLAWSSYPLATTQGLGLQWAVALLGIVVALTRETAQILRSLADILRIAIGGSLAVEVLSGLLIDMPIKFLNVHGNLPRLGPLQGLFGDRDSFGLACLVAILTFAVEAAMRSVTRTVSVLSLVGAVGGLLLTRSPVAIGAALVVALGAAALLAIRAARPEARGRLSLVVGLGAAVGAALAWIFRGGIIDALGATGEVSYRQALWERVCMLVPFNQVEGWGWAGLWRPELSPFNIPTIQNRVHRSASSAYVDALFQLGAVGLTLFIVLIGLTLVRLWIVGTRRPSVVAVWPVAINGMIAIASLAKSDALWGFLWLLLVICAVKASQQLSWRRAFTAPPPEGLAG